MSTWYISFSMALPSTPATLLTLYAIHSLTLARLRCFTTTTLIRFVFEGERLDDHHG